MVIGFRGPTKLYIDAASAVVRHAEADGIQRTGYSMSRLMVSFSLVALMMFMPVVSTQAQTMQNENLQVANPKGYTVANQTNNDRIIMSEMVPAGETVQNWTEMVTIQLFLKLSNVTPPQFRERLEKLWADSCPGSTFTNVKEGVENGYPTLTWLQKCPQNKETGKPEVTMLKGVQGRDSFYLVQKAFRFEPSAEQSTLWTKYLDNVQVCDTRLKDRPCRAP